MITKRFGGRGKGVGGSGETRLGKGEELCWLEHAAALLPEVEVRWDSVMLVGFGYTGKEMSPGPAKCVLSIPRCG